MKITLTSEQKSELELAHSQARDGRVRDRIKAVLLTDEQWSVAQIAQALRLHESTVIRHLHDYIKQNKLNTQNGGSESRLSAAQTAQVIAHITEHTYFHTHQIATYIKECFGVTYTVAGLNKWLHRNGFTYKQPKGVPHKFDEAKQALFIDTYQKLKTNITENEVILFMDAVHPTQATKISCGWIRKGKDKVIETTGSRTRLNIVGALNLTNIAATVIDYYERVNGDSICAFFDKVREQYPKDVKINLVLDGAGYHRSEQVKEKAKEHNIALHFLPPYSPNLNPIERLWKVMNEEVRNNVYFPGKPQFEAAIKGFFTEKLPQLAESLCTRLNDNFQVLTRTT